MSKALAPKMLVVLALAACNAAPSTLLVKIVPTEPEGVEARVRSDDAITVQFISEARDLDGDALTYEYAWSVDGTERPEFTQNMVPAEATAKGQVWSVMVTPTDGKRKGDPAVAEVTIGNTVPTSEASAPITEVVSTERLEMTGSGSDFDGDELTIEYYWTRDGEGTPFDGPTVPAVFTYPGEVWIGHAVANDGEDRSAPATVRIDILNGKPVIDSIAIEAEQVFTDTELVALVEASDPDDQPVELTYTWTVDGRTVQTGVDRSVLAPSLFAKHQEVSVSVVPSDGVDDGDAASVMVTVQNTPPTQPEIAIFPEEPIPGIDDMLCQLSVPSTDTDGDSIGYRVAWTVDGAAFTAASTTVLPGDTVPGRMFYDDEEWRCEITPFDDDTDGLVADITVVPETWAGDRVFTVCGNTGYKGPTVADCEDKDEGYPGTTLEDEVTVLDGIQEWTVPVDGTYRITARGAAGSASTGSPYRYDGGRGAILRGDFELKRGDVLQIVVGQAGKTDTYSAGGGGGSWVMMSDDTPMLVAGGGGASGYYGSYYGRRGGCDALTSQYGGQGSTTSYSSVPSTACRAKTSDLRRGGRVPGSYSGNGGAGIDANGTNDPYSGYGGTGGSSWSNGALGGKGAAAGGFGGGGGGNGSYASGGGGGYSGGDAGRTISGGAGSYNAGANQSNTIGNTDDGQVTVEWLGL